MNKTRTFYDYEKGSKVRVSKVPYRIPYSLHKALENYDDGPQKSINHKVESIEETTNSKKLRKLFRMNSSRKR